MRPPLPLSAARSGRPGSGGLVWERREPWCGGAGQGGPFGQGDSGMLESASVARIRADFVADAVWDGETAQPGCCSERSKRPSGAPLYGAPEAPESPHRSSSAGRSEGPLVQRIPPVNARRTTSPPRCHDGSAEQHPGQRRARPRLATASGAPHPPSPASRPQATGRGRRGSRWRSSSVKRGANWMLHSRTLIVTDVNPEFVQEFLNISVTRWEAVRKPDRVPDHAHGQSVAVWLPTSHWPLPYLFT